MRVFRKKSVLVEREKRVERELADLQRDIREIEKGIRNPRLLRRTQEGRKRSKSNTRNKGTLVDNRSKANRGDALTAADIGSNDESSERTVRRERLTRPESSSKDQIPAYLASAIHANRPLRYEREKQRNKAIMMIVIVGLFALWFLFRLLLT